MDRTSEKPEENGSQAIPENHLKSRTEKALVVRVAFLCATGPLSVAQTGAV